MKILTIYFLHLCRQITTATIPGSSPASSSALTSSASSPVSGPVQCPVKSSVQCPVKSSVRSSPVFSPDQCLVVGWREEGVGESLEVATKQKLLPQSSNKRVIEPHNTLFTWKTLNLYENSSDCLTPVYVT